MDCEGGFAVGAFGVVDGVVDNVENVVLVLDIG